jgi:hypothetical protein
MSNQTFKFAGYSVMSNGTCKARFGNDMVSRIKKLKDNSSHYFVELPSAMTKKEAAQYVLQNSNIPDAETKDALLKVVFRNVPKTQRVVNTAPKVEGAESVTVVKSNIGE